MSNPTKFIHKTESSTDEWLTPKYILDELGPFDLDPATPASQPWPTAAKTYSLERGEDGLLLPWEGRVFLNPPYSNWVPFVKKLKEHGNGIALIFARVETKGFFDHVWNDADALFFFKARLKFCYPDGTVGSSATAPSVLIAYGLNNLKILSNLTLPGKLIKLAC